MHSLLRLLAKVSSLGHVTIHDMENAQDKLHGAITQQHELLPFACPINAYACGVGSLQT